MLISFKYSHFLEKNSIGRIVRSIAESDPKANTEDHRIKNSIISGEMIQKQSIDKIMQMHLQSFSDKKGIIIDGYPRDLQQVKDFEEKVCASAIIYLFVLYLSAYDNFSTCSTINDHR